MFPTLHLPSFLRSISLTIRVSALLMLAVVVPLLITVIASEQILRPTLLSQAGVEMATDAQSHQSTIDSLFISRLQDIETLRHFLAIQNFLAGDNLYKQQALAELALGYRLDVNYSAWTLLDVQGKPLLSYPPVAPAPRGKYMVAPEMLAQLKSADRSLISNVYFDANTNKAFVDIYTSIISPGGSLLGIGRSTLALTAIWTAVNNETNAAPGSYAMVIDNNGMRIAYTNTDVSLTTQPALLFKAIAPIDAQFQQRIKDEDLYGNSHAAVKTEADPALVSQQPATNALFQLTPALATESYQAYQIHCQVVPWTYLVLRPVSTITKAANQQDYYLFLIAAVVMVLAAIVGIFVGRGITRPISGSVVSLIKSSEMLKTLANRERATATEQKWIVDSAQTGLQSVQYYAEASSVAARKLDETGRVLLQGRERMNMRTVGQHLNEIIATANYLEKASSHQEQSSKRLATAIRITNQVTEQLLAGATSASEAADQLEDVIAQLRRVVGN